MPALIDLPSSPHTHDLRRRWLGTRAYVWCQLAGWGGLSAIWISPALLGNQNRLMELLFALVLGVSGAGLSHLLRIALLAQLRRARAWPRLAARILPWVLGAAAAQVGVLLWFIASIEPVLAPTTAPAAEEESHALIYLDLFSLCFPLFTIWTGFYLGLRYYRQEQQAQADRLRLVAEAKTAELGALKAQLDPHFLFNSLNTIRALIPREGDAARQAVTQLSELLRASLTLSGAETIPLKRELEMVDAYLLLEHLRHEERLRVTRRIAPAALMAQVPPFLLQLLVENALKHGIAPRPAGGEVEIEATVQPDGLRLRVTNPGELGAGRPCSTGLGLKNARTRLALLYGPGARLEVSQSHPGRVEAEVFVPAAAAPPRSAADTEVLP
jgi:two-component system, LytTR family, sensor kinase